MDKLKAILEEVRPDINFEEEKRLVDGDILDSFDIIAIVGEINDQYGIEINVNDLLPENFNSAASIYELIIKLQNK